MKTFPPMRTDKYAQWLLWEPANDVGVQLFRFIVVGVVAFAVDFSILMLGIAIWDWHYLMSAAVGYVVGLMLNYSLSVRWVFAQRRFQDQGAEFALFALIGVTGLGLNELILWTGRDMLGLDIPLAKFSALFAVAAWNFVARKIVLFADASETLSEEGA